MIPTVNVTVAVHEQDGSPVRDALVFARLTTVERYNGYVVAGEYEGRTDEKGRAVVAVFPNELGSEGSEYRFRIVTPAGKTFSVYATVPNSDCNLHQICELEPAERRGAGQVVTSEIAGHVTQSETARDMAREAASRAQASAAQVDASAQTATAAASQALGYSNAAKRASEDATALVQRAETAVAGFESEVIGRVEAETQRLGGEASTAVSTAKNQAMTALDAHTEQKTEGLDLHAADLKAALTASLGAREEEAIGAVRIERDAALVVLREEGAQFREDLNTLAERSEDAAKRAACSAAITVKAASDVDEALTDTALDLLAPQVVAEAVRQATEIALDSANSATVEAEKSRQSAETACACADESAASARAAAGSAAAAETSAGAAADSALAAAASEAVATAKAGEASTSTVAAKASENAAKASEQAATEAAAAATTKAGEASVSAAAAGVSEAEAAASATAASASANAASAAQTATEAACEETKKVAVLPATTTSRGSVMPDGATIGVREDGTITAKDVAIGGNLEDLASARGQIGDARQLADLDFNMLTIPGFYRTTGNPQNGPIGISGASIGSLFVSGMQGNGNRLFQIMVSGNGIYWRTSISGGTTWETWNQVLTGNKLGDGIRNTNGVISVPEYEGATASTAGTSGLVPPPLATDVGKTLGADGTWAFPKDVAIGGDLEDLASARGQIGDNIRINTASDLNAYTKAGNWLFSDAAAETNFPTAGKGGELNCYVSTTAIFQFFTEFNNNRRYIRYGVPNSTWTNWIQFISVAQLGDGIRNTNGVISVPEYEGATASAAGTSGLVPPAAAGQQESFLTGGGEYKPALTKISDSVSLEDSKTAASSMAVKTAYDRGSAGVTAAEAAREEAQKVRLPIGLVYFYPGKNVPTGSLRLDGQSIVGVSAAFPDFKAWAVEHAVLCTMTEYETELATYEGQCGRFGWDAATDTLRLPTISRFIGGATSVPEIGTAVQSGLPNATGSFRGYASPSSEGMHETSGVFSATSGKYGCYSPTAETYTATTTVFDASRSSSIFGRSPNSVTPPHVKYPYCIHVYNSAIGASEAQAAAFVGLVDGLRQDVPGLAAHAAGPSEKSINISLTGAVTEYSAPANGYVVLRGASQSTSAYISLEVKVTGIYIVDGASAAHTSMGLFVPISKGQKVTLSQNINVTYSNISAHFIYANGNAPSA